MLICLPALCNAQGFLDKMKKFAGNADTLGRMQGPIEYVIDGEGSITLPDSTVQRGTIKFIVTPDKADMTYFYFTSANEMKPLKMYSDEVLFFTVKGVDFYPVRTKEDDLTVTIIKRVIFMQMLNKSASDKFKMYLFRKLERNDSHIGDNAYDLHTGYYVKLPDFKNAHEIVDVTFSPFASKMSEYLKDCPELSEKIADKKKGYKVNMFKGAENNEVFLRVMNEYNDCGKN